MLKLSNIKWLGHASFQIKNSKVIYIDPWKITSGPPADIILITHSHYDHCSPEDIKKIQKQGTAIVAPADCAQQLSGNIQTIKPGQSLEIAGVKIEAIPAYNVGKAFHQKSSQWVGFVLTLDQSRVYHAGDTDCIPEMETLKRLDFALLPIGGTYTMNAQQAAGLADKIKPKIVIPMHYGSIVGDFSQAEEFKKICSQQVEILQA